MSLIVPSSPSHRHADPTAAARLMSQRADHAKGYHRGEYVCGCVYARELADVEVESLLSRLTADISEFERLSAA